MKIEISDEIPQVFNVDASTRPPPMGLLLKEIEKSHRKEKAMAKNQNVFPRWTGFIIVIDTQEYPSVLTLSATYLLAKISALCQPHVFRVTVSHCWGYLPTINGPATE